MFVHAGLHFAPNRELAVQWWLGLGLGLRCEAIKKGKRMQGWRYYYPVNFVLGFRGRQVGGRAFHSCSRMVLCVCELSDASLGVLIACIL